METNKYDYKNNAFINQLVQYLPFTKDVPSHVMAQVESLLGMDLSQIESALAMVANPSQELNAKNNIMFIDTLPKNAKVACPGVEGAYSHIACYQFFLEPNLDFYTYFEEVAIALKNGKADYGVLPMENSSIGSVSDVMDFVREHGCYINATVKQKIEHCLCIHPNTDFSQVSEVISHPQALGQSQENLKRLKLTPVPYSNTSAAAKKVGEGQEAIACICSSYSAKLYGLKIVKQGVQDLSENYTRFMCIASKAVVLNKADIVSISLSFPNQPDALRKLLTQFSVFNLDLCKIQSMPIAGTDFHVRFHLDFKGSLKDPNVVNLLGHMYSYYDDFQFIGNFIDLG